MGSFVTSAQTLLPPRGQRPGDCKQKMRADVLGDGALSPSVLIEGATRRSNSKDEGMRVGGALRSAGPDCLELIADLVATLHQLVGLQAEEACRVIAGLS